MKFYDFAQWSIIAGAVLLSAAYMLGRIAPQWRMQLAQRLQRPGYANWINRIGERIGGAPGCGSGCNTCGSCETPVKKNN